MSPKLVRVTGMPIAPRPAQQTNVVTDSASAALARTANAAR